MQMAKGIPFPSLIFVSDSNGNTHVGNCHRKDNRPFDNQTEFNKY
jgi:hypothetical protein